jgi:hypothetical protein
MQKITTILTLSIIITLNGASSGDSSQADPLAPSPELTQTFKAVQAIRTFAAEIAHTHAITRMSTEPSVEDSLEVEPLLDQTKQGLFLRLNDRWVAICTPWGRVCIYNHHRCDPQKIHHASTDFFNHFRLAFIQNEAEAVDNIRFFRRNDDGSSTEITKLKLELLRGTPTIIYAVGAKWKYPDDSLYKIRAVDDIQLPEPIERHRSEFLAPAIAEKQWLTMMEQHQA